MKMGATNDTKVLLVDSAAGIYVPQRFVSNYEADKWSIEEDDAAILEAGPDYEEYWDVWDDVLSNARHTDDDGHEWTLHQDEDLWAIREDHEWEED